MKKVQTHIPYGFVIALIMIVIGVIFQVAKISDKPGLNWIPFIVMLVGIVLNAQAYSKANNAQVTFGQVFGSGFKASAIVAIVFVAWSFIALLIFPEIYTKAIEKVQEDMATKHLSQEQIDSTVKMTQKYFKVFMVAGALFGTMIMGLLFSIIGAAVAKKAPKQELTIS